MLFTIFRRNSQETMKKARWNFNASSVLFHWYWWSIGGSNPWPHDCQSCALPTAPMPHCFRLDRLRVHRVVFSWVIVNWSHWPGSNRPPARYECAALPDELQWLAENLQWLFYYVLILTSSEQMHFYRYFSRYLINITRLSAHTCSYPHPWKEVSNMHMLLYPQYLHAVL